MANAIKWEAAWVSRGTVLSTQLNSLAAAGGSNRSAAGTELDNSTNLDQYAVAELVVTFGSATAAGASFDLYMVTAPNGTNYEDGSNTVDPGIHTLVASIPTRADTAYRVKTRPFKLEPAKTKFLLLNGSNQAFPASGSVVNLYTTNDEIQ